MTTDRSLTVNTELTTGNFDEDLHIIRLSGQERMGTLFEYELELKCLNNELDIVSLLGTNVTATFDLAANHDPRHFNGVVSDISHAGWDGDFTRYLLTIRPWLWLLTNTSDCRIFQEKTVPDIIKEVLDDNGYSDFDFNFTGEYRTWEYCVQYRESDFNFISRLMEQEGIYYYFEHKEDKHIVKFCDNSNAHEALATYDPIPFYPPDQESFREEEHIEHWHLTNQLRSTSYALNDYNFKKPRAGMSAMQEISREHSHSSFEVYDYPGEYVERPEGENYAQLRIEQLQSEFHRVNAQCNVTGMTSGYLFELTNYPREDQNAEYLVVAAHYTISESDFAAGGPAGSASQMDYRCGFEAMPSDQPFRTPLTTPKPLIQGPQSATVVGPGGEEIWTDEYGRVKVQFPWDRHGNSDENSSCWIRASQAWAGGNWGTIHIPRIGQEVLVAFLEGDPDRPVIVGRVYNAANMPPYELPANRTQSGILSRSSKGGSAATANEFRFEDKMGEEEVYLHAEKDQNISVENCETHSVGVDRAKTIGNDETTDVGHDRTETVGNDESITIGNNETITIGTDRTETVGNNETITIGVDRTETVGSNETISIGSNRTTTVGVNEAITIGVAREKTVGAAESNTIGATRTSTIGVNDSLTVGSKRTEDIGGEHATTVGKDQTNTVGKNQAVTVGESRSITVGKDEAIDIGKNGTIKIGKKLMIEAGDEITIKTGKAQIVMKKNGDITIKGKKINVKGSGDIVMKGSNILQN